MCPADVKATIGICYFLDGSSAITVVMGTSHNLIHKPRTTTDLEAASGIDTSLSASPNLSSFAFASLFDATLRTSIVLAPLYHHSLVALLLQLDLSLTQSLLRQLERVLQPRASQRAL